MNMIGAYWREWWPEYYIETASAVTIHQTTTAMHPDKRLLCPWSIQAFQVFWEPICAKNDSRTLWEESIQSSIKFVYTCFKSMLCRISAWLNLSVYSTNFRMNQCGTLHVLMWMLFGKCMWVNISKKSCFECQFQK